MKETTPTSSWKTVRHEAPDIDPTNVEMGWVIDFCCQALRNIIIGIDGVNGKADGFMMKSKFGIAVSSEVMAILSLATDLKDMRERMGKIVVAYNKKRQTRDHRRPAGGRRYDRLDGGCP